MSFWFTDFSSICQGSLKNTTGLSGFKMKMDTQIFGPERWF